MAKQFVSSLPGFTSAISDSGTTSNYVNTVFVNESLNNAVVLMDTYGCEACQCTPRGVCHCRPIACPADI